MTASNQGFGSMRHLAARFFDSLRPAGPPPSDEAWACSQLLPGEQDLWARMSGPDRRHAVGVARDAVADLNGDGESSVSRPVMAAALLHDVGKVESGLGTWARAGVTIVSMAVGRDRVAGWSPPAPSPSLVAASPDPSGGGAGRVGALVRRRRGRDGMRAAAGRYVTHDQIGALLLRSAGSDPLTVTWAGEHHWPEASWTLDRRLADALKAADGD
jgi:hypothetical protein